MRFIFLFVVSALYIFLSPLPTESLTPEKGRSKELSPLTRAFSRLAPFCGFRITAM